MAIDEDVTAVLQDRHRPLVLEVNLQYPVSKAYTFWLVAWKNVRSRIHLFGAGISYGGFGEGSKAYSRLGLHKYELVTVKMYIYSCYS